MQRKGVVIAAAAAFSLGLAADAGAAPVRGAPESFADLAEQLTPAAACRSFAQAATAASVRCCVGASASAALNARTGLVLPSFSRSHSTAAAICGFKWFGWPACLIRKSL